MPDLPEELMHELREAYATESEERLLKMANLLIEMEQEDNPFHKQQAIETFYRETHSLKGASGAVGKMAIMEICQAMEDVFSSIRDGLSELSLDILNMSHQTLNIMEILAKTDKNADVPWQTFPQKLREFIAETEDFETLSLADTFNRSSSSLRTALNDRKKEQSHLPKAEIFGKKVFSTETNPTEDEQAISFSPLPSISNPAPVDFEARKVTAIRINVDRLERLIEKTEELITLEQAAINRQDEIDKLLEKLVMADTWHDQLMDSLGILRQCSAEQVGIANLPLKALQAFSNIQTDMDVIQRALSNIEEDLYRLSRQEKDLRQTQMRLIKNVLHEALATAMLSFDEIFKGFPPLMRRLAQETGKEFTYIQKGEAIEVDRMILERLNDPLVHLLRNAVDHGLESIEERKARGKPLKGTIRLEAQQLDGRTVEILLTDDGQGLNREKILSKAVQLGLCAEIEADTLSNEQVYDFIFASGFSTKESVSNVSGRGLGMAIVRDTVQQLGGRIVIESEVGHGTTFHLILPISRSIFKGLLASAGTQRFVIPMENLDAVLSVPITDIHTSDEVHSLRYHGKPIHARRLVDMLQIPQDEKKGKQVETRIYAIISTLNQFVALEIDAVIGIQEVVVKSLGSQIKYLKHIAGITILGNGDLIPILRTSDLVTSITEKRNIIPPEHNKVPIPPKKRILVADDSPTSRLLVKNILLTAGYDAIGVVDGQEALTLLKQEPFDLLLTDVEMPRLNGFELTQTIRTLEGMQDLPIVLLTSLSSKTDRERGLTVGASAYIAKGEFDYDQMLDILSNLLGIS